MPFIYNFTAGYHAAVIHTAKNVTAVNYCAGQDIGTLVALGVLLFCEAEIKPHQILRIVDMNAT